MNDWNAETLHARWAAVPNDEIGGWAVTANDRTPLDGGRMAADLVMTREIAEHIADLHNQWVAQHVVTVRPSTAIVRGRKHKVTPLTIPAEGHKDFLARWHAAMSMWPNRPDETPASCPSRQPWICTKNDCPGCFNVHCWTTNPTACPNGCDVAPRATAGRTTSAEENR